MVATVSLKLCALACVVGGTFAQTPTNWPDTFQVDITTNHSWCLAADPGRAAPCANTGTLRGINGTLYYDWTQKAQRVDHGAGNYECERFYHTDGPCSLVMNPTGTYRILQDPLPAGQPDCCLDIPTIFSPPPDWATNGDPYFDGSGVTVPYTEAVGEKFLYLSTGTCNARTAGNNSGCHSYYEQASAAAPRPLLFTFPANTGLQDW
jgi:hypothetical protein